MRKNLLSEYTDVDCWSCIWAQMNDTERKMMLGTVCNFRPKLTYPNIYDLIRYGEYAMMEWLVTNYISIGDKTISFVVHEQRKWTMGWLLQMICNWHDGDKCAHFIRICDLYDFNRTGVLRTVALYVLQNGKSAMINAICSEQFYKKCGYTESLALQYSTIKTMCYSTNACHECDDVIEHMIDSENLTLLAVYLDLHKQLDTKALLEYAIICNRIKVVQYFMDNGVSIDFAVACSLEHKRYNIYKMYLNKDKKLFRF